MKRIISSLSWLLFIVMLILSLSILPASASDASTYDVAYALETSVSSVDAGESFELRVKLLEGSKPFKFAQTKITFDDSVSFVESKLEESIYAPGI